MELEILGDGTQTKSYLHISDCIEAMFIGLEKASESVEIFKVGSQDQVDVKTIAKIVIEEMGLKNVKLKFTGRVNGGRGWKGDVKKHAPRHKQAQSPRMETQSQKRTGRKKGN